MELSVKPPIIKIEPQICLILTEAEARALSGIFGYSVEAFLQAFYKNMGKAYVEPYEAGVRSLHATMRHAIDPALNELQKTRDVINSALKLRRR